VISIHESSHAEFNLARESILQAKIRHELLWQEIPSPENVVNKSLALGAGVKQGTGSETSIDSQAGAGRFMLLHDPDSFEEWGSNFRVVCFAQAPLEVEIGLDPFIADVTWAWLLDALEATGASYTNISGTATKIISEGFGGLAHQGKGSQLELRASWSPTGTQFATHAEAWSEVLCSLAGFPQQEGTVSLDAFRNAHHRPQ